VRLHSLELLPDAAGQEAVRRDWASLREAGLPSQLDHRGASNAPHVTLLAAPDVAPALATAADLELPVEVRAAGLLVLGGARVTLARALDVPDRLLRTVLALRAAVPSTAGSPHQGWLPHVTLARRLARADLQRAVDAVGHADVVLRLVELRRWDPDREVVETFARA
jgi:hypothetical protein